MKFTINLNDILRWSVSLIIISELVVSDDISCPRLTFSNGSVKYAGRRKYRVARLICNKGFELVGGKYAMCNGGKWDMREPFCIKSGCKRFPDITNGMVFYLKNNAQAMFFCHPSYQLKGSSSALCNGATWNTTLPVCEQVKYDDLQLSCDFETRLLCGWRNDLEHDFDWTRKYLNTPSGILGTGPSYDHTYGTGKLGYYMYIESSSRLVNDTARLISPLYPGKYTQNGCFEFYYHMYGSTTGTLRIYVHPENIEFGKIINDTKLTQKYKMFEKSGNKGNIWFKGSFRLEKMDTNFQIVIEGVRGSGYASDIAIDDISILQNEKCAQLTTDQSSITVPPLTVKDSCLNRCGVKVNKTFDGENVECQCHVLCDVDKNCCVDYEDFCIFALNGRKGYVTYPTVVNDSMSTDSSSSTPLMLPIPQKNIATKSSDETIPDVKYATKEYQYIINTTTSTSTPVVTTISTTLTKVENVTIPSIVKKLTKDGNSSTSVAPQTKTTPVENKKLGPINFDNSTMYDVVKLSINNSTTNAPLKIKNETVQTTQLPIQVVSKHYGHYGRENDGKLKVSTVAPHPDDIDIINLRPITADVDKIEKNDRFKVPMTVKKNHIETSFSPIITILILLGVTLLIVSFVVVKFELVSSYCGKFTNAITGSYRRWTRTGSLSNNQSDMRFLVHDEELENYVD